MISIDFKMNEFIEKHGSPPNAMFVNSADYKRLLIYLSSNHPKAAEIISNPERFKYYDMKVCSSNEIEKGKVMVGLIIEPQDFNFLKGMELWDI